MAAFRFSTNAFHQGQQMFFISRQLSALSSLKRYVVNSLPMSTHCVMRDFQRIPLHDARYLSTSSANPNPPKNLTGEGLSSTEAASTDQVRTVSFDPALVDSLLQNMNGDLPLSEMPDPFVKDYRRCYLCKQNVKLDHKNVRLLSQFVSPYTGRIYGRAVTGLCIPMQKHVSKMIKRARNSGYMPVILKDDKYLQDPQPFNPMAERKAQ